MNAKGSVDLRPESDNFSVVVKAARFPYEVFGKKLPFEKVTAKVSERGNGIRFEVLSTLLGGGFGIDGVAGADRRPSAYSGEIRLKGVSLQQSAQIYSKNNDTEGDITGHFKFNGIINDWQALKGNGALTILNGDLYSIPIVGLLAPMLGTILPKQIAGYNIAKEADCTFDVADGFILTKDFEALTSTFKILLDGKIDFIRDALDLTAQVRVRGLPGIVFLPFSELLQYKGEGSISKAQLTAQVQQAEKGALEMAQRKSLPAADVQSIKEDFKRNQQALDGMPGNVFKVIKVQYPDDQQGAVDCSDYFFIDAKYIYNVINCENAPDAFAIRTYKKS